MQLPLTGGCQCGSVRYQITREPARRVRLPLHGMPAPVGQRFALSLAVAREALVVVEGAPPSGVVSSRAAASSTACSAAPAVSGCFTTRSAIPAPRSSNRARSMTPHGSSRWDTSGPSSAQSWVPIPQTTVELRGASPRPFAPDRGVEGAGGGGIGPDARAARLGRHPVGLDARSPRRLGMCSPHLPPVNTCWRSAALPPGTA